MVGIEWRRLYRFILLNLYFYIIHLHRILISHKFVYSNLINYKSLMSQHFQTFFTIHGIHCIQRSIRRKFCTHADRSSSSFLLQCLPLSHKKCLFMDNIIIIILLFNVFLHNCVSYANRLLQDRHTHTQRIDERSEE